MAVCPGERVLTISRYARCWLWLDQVLPDRELGELHDVVGGQLAHEAVLVGLHRLGAEAEVEGGLLDGVALREPQEDLPFPAAQQAHAILLRSSGRGTARGATAAEYRRAIVSVAAVAIAAAIAVTTGLFSGALTEGLAYPGSAVAFMNEHGLHGNLLCDFNWGEYVIWHMAPQSKVFIDGRYDTVYPQQVINDYLRLHFTEPGASRVLDAYPHDFVIVPPGSGEALVTSKSPNWRLIYNDGVAAIFARAGLPAANLSGAPFTGPEPSGLFP